MGFTLSEAEVRVLGSLIEKDMATPEYYPLSLNALTNACNQKSNRDPVVSYDEDTVFDALESLREKGLADTRHGPDSRVPKHAHRLSEVYNFSNPELAVLGVLLLRGAQTVGELRQRTERMHHFDSLESVDGCLRRLMEREPEPLVKRLPRQPGEKEPRYIHLLAGDVAVEAAPEKPAAPDRLARLEEEFALLKQEVGELKRRLDDFQRQFE